LTKERIITGVRLAWLRSDPVWLENTGPKRTGAYNDEL